MLALAVVRILHFSDTHLGHGQYSRSDAATGINQREQDHYDAFGRIIDHAVTTRPDLVVHAGDLFDGVRPSNRALAVAMEGFLKLSKAGIPTVLIAGNHEHPKLRETGSPFRLFGHLDHVHPIYKSQCETIEIGEGLRVHAVPQCIDNDALAKEVAAIKPSASGHDVLVLHGAVHSLDGFKHAEFNELSLDPSWFDDRFDYVALGHFHSQAQVTTNAWYCGAPDRVSIAEAGEEKGFLEVELGAGGRADVHFTALAGRTYMDLPVLKADGLDGTEVVQAAVKELDRAPKGAVVRLRIQELDPTLRGLLDRKTIQDAAGHLLHLDLRLDWRPDDDVRPGSADLGGLDDEFTAFAATHPVDGLDRERLITMARQVLADAQGGST